MSARQAYRSMAETARTAMSFTILPKARARPRNDNGCRDTELPQQRQGLA